MTDTFGVGDAAEPCDAHLPLGNDSGHRFEGHTSKHLQHVSSLAGTHGASSAVVVHVGAHTSMATAGSTRIKTTVRLTDLPMDIWEHLFRRSGLGVVDLVKLSRVCRSLRDVARSVTAIRARGAHAVDNDDRGLLGAIRGWDSSANLPPLPSRNGRIAAEAWPNVLFVRTVSPYLLTNDREFVHEPPDNVLEVVPHGVDDILRLVSVLRGGRKSLRAVSLRQSLAQSIPVEFGALHSLDLSGCSRITAVPGLDHVHTLNLSYCNALTDVSNLGGVHNLDLTMCGALTDVSALGSVHTLHLSNCWNLCDVSGLGKPGQVNLYLSGCKYVVDVSHLGGVHTLRLSHCENVVDVSGLGTCHTLYLDGCTNIEDVSALVGVHTLNLVGCRKVRNADVLVHCHDLIRP